MDKSVMKLNDDMLESVAGGVERVRYSDSDLMRAGVTIQNKDGKKVYRTILDGRSVDVSESVAIGMCDCYKLSGGNRLTDQQLRDLISQS